MSAPTRGANEPLISTSVAGLRTALASFAREHLPEAMVPTRFVILDELPKLPNGKVDRSRLPTRDAGETAGATYLPPSTPEEIRIAQIWRDVLGVSRVGVEDSFFDLGGDSLSAAQMGARVKEEFGVALSLRRLFEHPTVAELARMVGAKGPVGAAGTGSPRSLSNEDLIAEAQLPADIVPARDAAAPASAPYRTILLTGATGYTGAYLMREILERSEARVYALARAKDARDAVNRVRRNLASYGLWRDSYEGRVVGVAGDLGRPYFGVSRAVYEELAEQVEMIVHNGALSSYALPYRRLKAVNVLGTQEVLRLACKRRIKPLHFISSLAVFPGHPGVHDFKEVEVTDPVNVLGGYRQTKWVADRLVTLAGHRGLPVSIYRPGLITGAQDTGACSTDTFLNAAMKGCIQLGAALDFDVMVEMVPVDFCAQAVAYIALSGKRHGMRFHLPSATPLRWSQLLNLLEECGYPLRRVSYRTWYRELAAAVEQGADNALTKFFPLFGEDTPSVDVGYPDSEPHFATDHLQEALAGSGIACRPVDASFLSLYLEYFVSIGYLPPPTRKGTRSGGAQL
jgi:thioester reductase-like protein